MNGGTRACIFIIVPAVIFVLSTTALSQVRYERSVGLRRNAFGGYDSYNKKGRKVSSSRVDRKGRYKFYDAQGNKIGTLKRNSRSRGSYVFYDAEGIKRGVLRRRATGTYYYKNVESGEIVNVAPEAEGEVSSLKLDLFGTRGN